MKSMLVRLEGLILVSVGACLGILALGGFYPYFMNPRYRWLSLIGLTGVVLIGIVRVLYPPRSLRLSRILPFVLFLGFFLPGFSKLSEAYIDVSEDRTIVVGESKDSPPFAY